MTDEDMVDVSPFPHSDERLVSIPLSSAINDESPEDDRFKDLFATKDDFHVYNEVCFSHDDHDMDADYWKFIGNPIYDYSSEGRVNFEDLGKLIFYEIPHDLVHPTRSPLMIT